MSQAVRVAVKNRQVSLDVNLRRCVSGFRRFSRNVWRLSNDRAPNARQQAHHCSLRCNKVTYRKDAPGLRVLERVNG